MRSFTVYVFRDRGKSFSIPSVIATTDEELVSLLIRLLPDEGYRIRVTETLTKDVGPLNQ